MAAFDFFPGGESRQMAEEALDFAAKTERDLRAQYERVKKDRDRLNRKVPEHLNDFQYRLALQQVEEEISELSILLLQAELKLEWERKKRWKKK